MTLLTKRMVEKPWGKDILPAPFVAPEGKRIGEVWFEPPPEMPSILVKYIFTSEKLSVQVHPSDAQTQAMGLGRQGKEECWLVIDAEPGATLAIGFQQDIAADSLFDAVLDGSVEHMLTWHPVAAGDFFYIPANTVHAIGAGITLVEVQQNSDITYRLYDYSRPRALHIKDGLAVALRGPHPGHHHRKLSPNCAAQLVEGPDFRLDRIHGPPELSVAARYTGAVLVAPLSCTVMINKQLVLPGECALAASLAAIEFPASGLSLITQPV
ncbi:class I mannose-6-phosphate isomerase [Novosphingobium sp.]|uniref:class I mannose-6-phosphate isomerase n=1 Tax=Novosphingobium sp. TaxID=1874826 RepID=UPI00356606A1